ncbi:Pre-rRNA-processing protein fhl1, partial [Physocladia obscura]
MLQQPLNLEDSGSENNNTASEVDLALSLMLGDGEHQQQQSETMSDFLPKNSQSHITEQVQSQEQQSQNQLRQQQQPQQQLQQQLQQQQQEEQGQQAQRTQNQQDAVQAYAKIEGRDFTYFVRKLVVVLGRKISPNDGVDVHLGEVKSISRSHAKIQFNFTVQCFEIAILGKNGAIVDGNFVATNSVPVPLYNKSRITIGEIECQFLLPKAELSNELNASTRATYPPYSTATTGVGQSLPYSAPTNIANLDFFETSQSQLSSQAQKTTPKVPAVKKGSRKSVSSSSDEMLEGTGGGVAGDEYARPSISYAAMISQALHSSAEKRLTLAEIYAWIMETYPYFRNAPNGWQ